MTSSERPFLGRAIGLSLALHAALLAAGARLTAPAPRLAPPAPRDFTVQLRETRAMPELDAPAPLAQRIPPPRHAIAARPAAPQMVSLRRLSGEAARAASEQLARELMYPAEAIERGLEGEALVLLFLDASGDAVAARLEASSGHALLDDAAVRAARTLRALPADAPREALLPVRFRLR